MGLVDNQSIVFAEETIMLNFSQQNTIGHQFDQAVGRTVVGEAHLIPHRLPQGGFKLLGNTRGNGACR